MDDLDLKRLALLLLAASEMSHVGYVLMRYSTRRKEWRVNVRRRYGRGPHSNFVEHTATSRASLLDALDAAVQWLRAERAHPIPMEVLR